MVGTSSGWNNEVSLAEMADLSAHRVIGRYTSTGIPQALEVGGSSGTNGSLIISNVDGGGPYLRPGGIRTGLLAFSDDADGSPTVVANTTTETDLLNFGVDGFSDEGTSLPTIAENSLVLGSCFEIRMIGKYQVAAATTPSIQFRFGIAQSGGSFIPFTDTGLSSVPVSGMSGLIELYGIFYMHAVGASANAIGQCFIKLTNTTTRLTYTIASPNVTLVGTLNSTVNGTIKALFKWDTAHADNTIHITNTTLLRLR